MLVLDIFFEALNYETVEQKAAYEVSELLGVCVSTRAPGGGGGAGAARGGVLTDGAWVSTGDIGGQMGLFIGASLLTILEILDYLCEVGPGPQLGEGETATGPRARWKLATCFTACSQVFRERVLGYFWNRKRSQKHSSTNLVTTSSSSPAISI